MINKLNPSYIIEKTWEMFPGYILCFPVGIGMSGKAAAERAEAIALSLHERADRLLDFRIRQVTDVLEAPPYMLSLDRLNAALEAKQDEAIANLRVEDEGVRREKVQRIRENLKLSPGEVEVLRESFPDFPETDADTLSSLAYDYFNQEDSRGRKVYQLLIEEVMQAYWVWATPRPTISVSVFTQSK